MPNAGLPVFKPSLTGFVVPLVAALGAVFGFLWGLSMGNGLLGFVVGAVLGAVIAYVLPTAVPAKKTGVLAVAILIGLVGFFLGGPGGAFAGVIIGAVVGNSAYWLATGQYRSGLPPYASSNQVLWHHFFRIGICGFIFFFLIAPILTIIPLSFNAEDFFTFTKKMLTLDPEGYSLKHYRDFMTNPDWQLALKNSFMIAPFATILATAFGTLAAIGLSQSHVPFRRAIMAVLISPMIVPLIISAAGMYFFYSRIGLQGTFFGVVLAHAALGTPFVIITVTATLVGFDRSLTRAAANMGADPVTTFFRVQMPLIIPGVVSGALFAFITSFDEVVVVLFLGSAAQKTLPWQMFTGLREQISPTILAVATIMVGISIVLLTVLEMLRRRSERLRGLSPA
jgi:putative spermidine/putrescine transport system permease protein